MSMLLDPVIRVRVDPTNPGLFFACCGLLELAARLWNGAEGWFAGQELEFLVRPLKAVPGNAASLLSEIARCSITNTMSKRQSQRRGELSNMTKKQRKANPRLEAEKKDLDALYREAPVLFDEPFHLRLDWFLDDRAGGDDFKTWAGQQSVLDISRGMREAVDCDAWSATPQVDWLFKRARSSCLPFNFDSDLGAMGSDRDVGFSFDPLKTIRVETRPLLELLAFVGLQRFRPLRMGTENRYRFALWFEPLVPEVASIAGCGLLESSSSRVFEFRLLYRTKYLKSFLPANPMGGHR
jgi:CRISPR-associated protein Csb3